MRWCCGVPDDWHLHLRDGAALQRVLPFTAARFARAIVMPNLAPPDDHHGARRSPTASASSTALPPGAKFEPLMTLYLTDAHRAEPRSSARTGERHACFGCKLYPAGATTHPRRASRTSNASTRCSRA